MKMEPTNYIVYSGVTLGSNVDIGDFTVLGRPTRSPTRAPSSRRSRLATEIGGDVQLGSHVLVEAGARIGRACVVESHAVIEAGVSIGERSFLVHGARICADATLGDSCVVGGFVAERSIVGAHCRVFGRLVHRQIDTTVGWDDVCEPAPTLERNVFVAMGAIIVGPVRLASRVYVVPGAVVTRDIPSCSVVHGVNCVVPASEWKGSLSQSPLWRNEG